MKPFTRRRCLLTGLAALAAAGIAIAALSDKDKPVSQTPPAQQALELGRADVARASMGALTRRVEVTGTLEAVNQTTITAPVEAEVAEVRVRPGDAVKKGEVLLRFSTTNLQLRLKQQQAQVDGARAQLQLATTTYEQQKALLQQQYISQNAFQNAESTLTSARSALRAAEAQMALAREQVNDAAVHAPFAARVAERRVEPGQRVGPNTPLLRLVDTAELELAAAVAGADIPVIRQGQSVTLFVEGLDEKSIQGTVSRIAPAADSASRRVPVYIRVDNPAGGLQAGLFARGQITVSSAPNVISVPSAALRRSPDGHSWVWKISNERLHKQAVVSGSADDATQRVAVLQGLAANELVLLVPGEDFTEGQAVRLQPATKPQS